MLQHKKRMEKFSSQNQRRDEDGRTRGPSARKERYEFPKKGMQTNGVNEGKSLVEIQK